MESACQLAYCDEQETLSFTCSEQSLYVATILAANSLALTKPIEYRDISAMRA